MHAALMQIIQCGPLQACMRFGRAREATGRFRCEPAGVQVHRFVHGIVLPWPGVGEDGDFGKMADTVADLFPELAMHGLQDGLAGLDVAAG